MQFGLFGLQQSLLARRLDSLLSQLPEPFGLTYLLTNKFLDAGFFPRFQRANPDKVLKCKSNHYANDNGNGRSNI